MTPFDWIAAAAAFGLLGIPLYWLVLHPFAGFWRTQPLLLAFGVAATAAWGASGAFVWMNQARLFAAANSPVWATAIGLMLMVVEIFMIRKVARAMGPARLVGKVEMGGAGQLEVSGIYSRIRHPSYAGMMGAMLGVGLMAWTEWMAATAAAWFVLMRVMIAFEERELVKRFGAAYEEYRRRVPAFLPFRF